MTQPIITMGLVDAAKFLGIHPNTLQTKAKAKEIPGAKLGRAWRFIESDLVAHMRQQYAPIPCPSTSKLVARSGGPRSRVPDAHGYVNRLEKLIAERRKKSTTA